MYLSAKFFCPQVSTVWLYRHILLCRKWKVWSRQQESPDYVIVLYVQGNLTLCFNTPGSEACVTCTYSNSPLWVCSYKPVCYLIPSTNIYVYINV